MADTGTVLYAARLVWQLLGKVPWLSRLLLRRAFPIAECQRRLAVDMPGNHARFELLSIRPSPALVGVQLRLHNVLPFPVTFEASRLISTIDSTGFLDIVLNERHCIPAAGFARIPLPEIGLTSSQAGWVRALNRDCTRVQLKLHWRCASPVHDWEGQGTYEGLLYVNKDGSPLSGSGAG
ncbi:MAG: hypothetical protein WD051_11075 [Steroidobacteraceae bacterium]